MRPERIRKLDRWFGAPACALLTAFENVRRLFTARPDSGPKRIVFIKLIEMGSTVLATPAFREAEAMVGRGNMFFLVFAQNRPIVDLLPFFPPGNVITIDDSTLLSFARGLFAAMSRIRREKIDTAIDMEGLTRSSAVISYLTGCRRRAGYHNFTSEGPYRGRLFTHELNYSFQHHISRQFVALVRAAARPPGQVPMLKERIADGDLAVHRLAPSEQDKTEVTAMLCGLAGRTVSGPVFLLNPNCSDLLPLRRWPSERFVELGRRLLAGYPDALVALTGAPAEKEEASRLAAVIAPRSNCVCTAGHTTMRQLIALYAVSRLLVTNDSGPAHFAALAGAPTVVLFGPETPLLYAPLGPAVKALSAGLACSPCVNILNHRFSPCLDNRCMAAISVDEVMKACESLLASP